MPADPCGDRIVVVGGSRDAVGLLCLARVRSDDVLVLADASDADLRAAAERLGAVRHGLDYAPVAFGAADVALVAESRPVAQEALAAAARARGLPVFVTGRPDLSDFTLLEFLERRSCSRAAAP